jgi:hypothetical protein
MARSRYEPWGFVRPQVIEAGRIAGDAPAGDEAHGTDGRVHVDGDRIVEDAARSCRTE